MRLVIFGCSHSVYFSHTLSDNFLEGFDKFIPKGRSGNSNAKIIHDVYDFINSNEFNIDTDVLSIQYTYTNRFWSPNILPKSEYSFHTLDYGGPIFKENPSFLRNDLKKMYETYLTYFWDYNLHFDYLVQKIDLLKSYLDSKNIKYVFYSWTDGGNTDEWKQVSGLTKTKDEDKLSYENFDKLGCIKIDGFRFIEPWAVKNNLLDETLHLTEEGNILFSKFLRKIIKEKF
jgi:hypothetical protein